MRKLVASLVLLFAATFSAGVYAETYPSAPIRVVNPFPAGSGGDTLLRIIAQDMGEYLKQPVIVENKTGANGRIGAQYVAAATPDGYTVLFGSAGPISIAPLISDLNYVPSKDLIPVSRAYDVELILAVSKSFPAQTFGNFISEVRASPGKYSFGTAGTGSGPHLAVELLKLKAGLKVTHVPYRGDAPAIQDLLGNHIAFGVFAASTVAPFIASAEVRPIASLGQTRSVGFPDIPTVNESGFPGVIGGTWQGFFVPAKTPQLVVDRLYAAVKHAVNQPAIHQKLIENGATPVGDTPEEFLTFLRAESSRIESTIKEAKLELK